MCRLLVGQIVQAIAITDGRPHAQVVMRKHVQPPQREYQEHLRRPATDALHLGEVLHDPVVRQPPDMPKINRPGVDLARQVGNVGCLLRRQTDRPQLIPGELGKVRRFQPIWPGKFLQPPADGTGSTGRDLLGNDGPDEHAEPVTLKTQREWPHGVDHGLHHGIGCPEMAACFLDGGLV